MSLSSTNNLIVSLDDNHHNKDLNASVQSIKRISSFHNVDDEDYRFTETTPDNWNLFDNYVGQVPSRLLNALNGERLNYRSFIKYCHLLYDDDDNKFILQNQSKFSAYINDLHYMSMQELIVSLFYSENGNLKSNIRMLAFVLEYAHCKYFSYGIVVDAILDHLLVIDTYSRISRKHIGLINFIYVESKYFTCTLDGVFLNQYIRDHIFLYNAFKKKPNVRTKFDLNLLEESDIYIDKDNFLYEEQHNEFPPYSGVSIENEKCNYLHEEIIKINDVDHVSDHVDTPSDDVDHVSDHVDTPSNSGIFGRAAGYFWRS